MGRQYPHERAKIFLRENQNGLPRFTCPVSIRAIDVFAA
jgi:hypothetical protein